MLDRPHSPSARQHSPLGRPSSPSARPSSPSGRGRRSRSRKTIVAIIVLFLASVTLLFGRSGRDGSLLQRVGVAGYRGNGPVSRHREPISIVLMAGANERSILEVTRAILATTVGPYELIGCFTGDNDASEAIVADVVKHHQAAKVDFTGRGLQSYTTFSTYPPPSSPIGVLHLSAIRSAKYGAVAIINANDLMDEYGWDRILLTGLKSSPDLLAVSGRAAANLEYGGGKTARLVDGVGEPLPESHHEDASGPLLHVRQVAMRSPILYDARKLGDLGWNPKSAELEEAGMGDLDICLRARRDHGWKCAYYPVSVKTKDNWKLVPGTAGFGLELELSKSDIKLLALETHRSEDAELETIAAIRREVEDIPKTIVTAITASQVPYFQHLYTTLDWSAHTRYILYLLPTSTLICLSEITDLRGIEIRKFGSKRLPPWMHADNAMGQYAWKMYMIKEVMEDYGGLVFWLDPNKRLISEMKRTWSDVAGLGVWTTSSGGPLSTWTHPGMIAHFDLPASTWSGTNCNSGNMGFNSHNAGAMTKIVRPLFNCAANRDCIAPIGSSRANHRQDQAALTALIHLNGYGCELKGPIEDQREKQNTNLGKCEGEAY